MHVYLIGIVAFANPAFHPLVLAMPLFPLDLTGWNHLWMATCYVCDALMTHTLAVETRHFPSWGIALTIALARSLRRSLNWSLSPGITYMCAFR